MKKQGKKGGEEKVTAVLVFDDGETIPRKKPKTPALRKAGEAYFVGKRGGKKAPAKRPTREEKEEYVLNFLRTESSIAFVAFWSNAKRAEKSPFQGMSESTFRRTLKNLVKQGKVRLDKTDSGVYFVEFVNKGGDKDSSDEKGDKPADAKTGVVPASKHDSYNDQAGAILGTSPTGSPAPPLVSGGTPDGASADLNDPAPPLQLGDRGCEILDEMLKDLKPKERLKTTEELEEEINALLKRSADYRFLADNLERVARDLTLLKDLRHRLVTTEPLPTVASLREKLGLPKNY